MRLLVDCRYVTWPRHDGISRYTAGIVAALARHPGFAAESSLTMMVSDEHQLSMLPALPHVTGPSQTSPLEPLAALRINRLGFDLVFSPMQTIGSLGRRFGLVTTIHDLTYYEFPAAPPSMPWFVRGAWWLYHQSYLPERLLLRGSDATVAITETTRQSMLEHRLTRSEPAIVGNGAPGAIAARPRTAGARTRELVYMGAMLPHKSVDTIVRAMTRLPEYELHVCSRIADAERARLERLAPAARIVWHNGIDDDDYAVLLARAFALVSASRAEGFGIPVVEAGALGTPQVLTDLPVFHEVAGEGAAYFAPLDAAALATAVRALEPVEAWERASAAALDAAGRWSWDRSAEELVRVLDAVAARRGTPRRASHRA